MSKSRRSKFENGWLQLLEDLVSRVGGRHGLALREVEVLKLSACGFGSKEIAGQLGCSPKTVDEYWRRIYFKWGSRSRQRIVAESVAEAIAEFSGLYEPTVPPAPGLRRSNGSAGEVQLVDGG